MPCKELPCNSQVLLFVTFWILKNVFDQWLVDFADAELTDMTPTDVESQL